MKPDPGFSIIGTVRKLKKFEKIRGKNSVQKLLHRRRLTLKRLRQVKKNLKI